MNIVSFYLYVKNVIAVVSLGNGKCFRPAKISELYELGSLNKLVVNRGQDGDNAHDFLISLTLKGSRLHVYFEF